MGLKGGGGGASVVGYDSACHDLAGLFLEEEGATPADVARLAQAIQDSIEEFFFVWEYERREAKKGEDDKHVVAAKGHRRSR